MTKYTIIMTHNQPDLLLRDCMIGKCSTKTNYVLEYNNFTMVNGQEPIVTTLIIVRRLKYESAAN